MARDIIEMPEWETECPCCKCKVALEWQIATHGDGTDSYQFLCLRRIESTEQPRDLPKHEYIQSKNPRSQRYTLVDRTEGRIVSRHPRKNTPYKNVPTI